jgi:hypothetical protein
MNIGDIRDFGVVTGGGSRLTCTWGPKIRLCSTAVTLLRLRASACLAPVLVGETHFQ